jgi:hypothetical protein
MTMQIQRGKKAAPRRVLLYGQHGVGKSTWAANAPKPIFLDVEDGLADLDCDKTNVLSTFGDVVSAVSWLVSNDHDYRTCVLDTADWLEQLVWKAVAEKANKSHIEDIGYGKGYALASTQWDFLLAGFDALRNRRGMHVIVLAHAAVVKFQSPETDAYDRYEPALHKLASRSLQEWADEVLFASFRVFTRKEDQGFNRERAVGVGSGERYVRTQESAAVAAKNRLGLPVELPFTWDAYAAYLPKATAKAVQVEAVQGATLPVEPGNIAGLVVDGSSKVSA